MIDYIASSAQKEVNQIKKTVKMLSRSQSKHKKLLEQLLTDCKKLNKKLKTTGVIISAVAVIVAISQNYKSPTGVSRALVDFVLDLLVDLIIYGTSKIVGALSPKLPGIAYLSSAFLSIVVELVMESYFTDKRVSRISLVFVPEFYNQKKITLKLVFKNFFKAVFC